MPASAADASIRPGQLAGLRVLALSDVMWPEGSGGVERTLAEIYPRIARAYGTRIRLLTLAGATQPRRTCWSGIEIERARRVPLEKVSGAQVAVSLDLWPRLLRTLRSFRPRVVHLHTLYFHSALAGAIAGSLAGVPLVMTVHLGSPDTLPQPYRAATSLYAQTVGRALLARCKRVICVSEDVRQHVVSLGVRPSRLTVIPNGVDCARYRPAERRPAGTPTAVFVGRLIVNKGPQVLVAALARLNERDIPLRVQFVGEGPMANELRALCARHGVSGRVEFLGQREDVPELLAAADLFVRPSFSEGMSLAVLEAMAAGLPTVATRVSGNAELVEDGCNGLLVRAADPDDLARALARLAIDGELRARMGQEARKRAERFDWNSAARQTALELARACV